MAGGEEAGRGEKRRADAGGGVGRSKRRDTGTPVATPHGAAAPSLGARNPRLFVQNLPFSATVEEVAAFFGKHGQIVNCRLITDRVTKRSRGMAFVSFASADAAATALTAAQGRKCKGRELVLQFAEPKRSGEDAGAMDVVEEGGKKRNRKKKKKKKKVDGDGDDGPDGEATKVEEQTHPAVVLHYANLCKSALEEACVRLGGDEAVGMKRLSEICRDVVKVTRQAAAAAATAAAADGTPSDEVRAVGVVLVRLLQLVARAVELTVAVRERTEDGLAGLVNPVHARDWQRAIQRVRVLAGPEPDGPSPCGKAVGGDLDPRVAAVLFDAPVRDALRAAYAGHEEALVRALVRWEEARGGAAPPPRAAAVATASSNLEALGRGIEAGAAAAEEGRSEWGALAAAAEAEISAALEAAAASAGRPAPGSAGEDARRHARALAGARTVRYGSSACGLEDARSDADVGLAFADAAALGERRFVVHRLKAVAAALRARGHEVTTALRARVPVVRATVGGVRCDVTAHDPRNDERTAFVRAAAERFAPARALVLAVKRWTVARGLRGSQLLPNTWTWVLLALTAAERGGGHASAAGAMRALFELLARGYSYGRQVVRPRDGTVADAVPGAMPPSALYVEDPADAADNTARGTEPSFARLLRREAIRAAMLVDAGAGLDRVCCRAPPEPVAAALLR